MNREKLDRCNDLAHRIGQLKELLKAGPLQFIARDRASEYEVNLSKGCRDKVAQAIQTDLEGQLATAQAEFDAL